MLNKVKSFLRDVLGARSTTTLDLDSVLEDGSASSPVSASEAEAAQSGPTELLEFGSQGISFTVDNVVPASDPLWQGTLAESAAKILVIPEGDLPCLAPEGYFAHFGESQKPRREQVRTRMGSMISWALTEEN